MASAVERLASAVAGGGSLEDLIPLGQLAALPDHAFFALFERLLTAVLDTDSGSASEVVRERVTALLEHLSLDIERGLNENYPIDVVSRYLAYRGATMTTEQQALIRRLYDHHHLRYLTTLLQLANWVGDGRGLVALQALHALQGLYDGQGQVLTPAEARLVLDTARSYNNHEFISSFSEWFLNLLPTAAVPSYVRDLGLRDLDLEAHRATLLAELSPELVRTAGELMAGLAGLAESEGSPESGQPRELDLLALGQLARLQDDPVLVQALGPVNHSDQTPDEACQRYGGCRYLTCRCHEAETYDDQGLPDWFLGYCVECGDVIPSRQAATRQTLPHGGYHGCYCSVRCLAIHLYNLEHQDSYHHDQLEPTLEDGPYDRQDLLKRLAAPVAPGTIPDALPDRELYYLTKLPLLDQLLTATTLQQLYRHGLQDGRRDGQVQEPVRQTNESYYQAPEYYEQLFGIRSR